MDNFSLVIFGITSNLAQIKLIPTLYDLVAGKHIDANFQVIGVGRTVMDQNAFKAFVAKTLRTPNRHHTHPIDENIEKEMMSHLTYLSADLTSLSSYEELKKLLSQQNTNNHMFYLATFPSLYGSIFQNLKDSGLSSTNSGWTRLLIEKPIGNDRDSANQLNELLTTYFKEEQIFRLDHYLGKETLQNILTFRFGNGLFEPLMNADHIDHIQITASEDFGIGSRGSYYDQNGAIKDVGQNHLLQIIALSCMDTPSEFNNQEVTRARVNLLKNLVPDPNSLIIGQYDGYKAEKDVSPHSSTETYFAFKTKINNDRFKDVPIYVRGGKYLARTATEVAIVFKNQGGRIFNHLNSGTEPNVLIFRIQPNEGIILKIMTKQPGHELHLEESYMQYCYPRKKDLPDAYERLIVDALKGDQTFFNDANEVDAQWAFTDPLINAKHNLTPSIYSKGSWGPEAAADLLKNDGRSWYEPSTAYCAI